MVEQSSKKPNLSRILAAAGRVFAQRGYDGTSLQEVAEEAGVTKPTVYNYFSGKAALYEQTLAMVHRQMIRRLQQAARQGETAYDRVLALMRCQLQFAREYADLIRVSHSLMFLPDDVRPRFDAEHHWRERFEVIHAVIREGVRAAELRGEPLDIALAVSSSIGSLALLQAMWPDSEVLEPGVEQRLWDVIYQGARAPEAAPARRPDRPPDPDSNPDRDLDPDRDPNLDPDPDRNPDPAPQARPAGSAGSGAGRRG